MKTSKEDYLGEIYRIQSENNGVANITDIAKRLNISKPSVTQMIQKLSKEGLLESSRYKGVSLTKNGIIEARKLVRKHQILEVFFEKILGIKNNFHTEAHNIEHAISDESVDKLDNYLEKPEYCPDGKPIPTKENNIIQLSEASKDVFLEVIFSRVQEKNSQTRLNSLGIIPQAKIKILEKVENGPVILLVKDSKIAIDNKICSEIFVKNYEK